MRDQSTAHPAHPSTPRELLAGRLEEELARLKHARPELADRADRAAEILVRQLSSPPRLRCVRVRVGRGQARFLVDSSSAGGAVYSVDPRGFRCSCPDAHRRDAACKHSIAAWCLWRLSLSVDRAPCAGCGLRFRHGELVELHEGNHDGLTYFHGDRLCPGCADGAGVAR